MIQCGFWIEKAMLQCKRWLFDSYLFKTSIMLTIIFFGFINKACSKVYKKIITKIIKLRKKAILTLSVNLILQYVWEYKM